MTKTTFWLSILAISVVLIAGSLAVSPIAIAGGDDDDDDDDDVGTTGATGPPGATGMTGMTGMDGADGATGATGPAGADGVGAQGSLGATGPAGADGMDGAPGATGMTGMTGMDGAGTTFKTYVKSVLTLDGTTSVKLSVSCDAGDVLTGSGFDVTNSGRRNPSLHVLSPIPSATDSTPTGIEAEWDNAAGNQRFILYAICADIAAPFKP